MLFLGNKAPDSVTAVSITVAPSPALQVQVRGVYGVNPSHTSPVHSHKPLFAAG